MMAKKERAKKRSVSASKEILGGIIEKGLGKTQVCVCVKERHGGCDDEDDVFIREKSFEK